MFGVVSYKHQLVIWLESHEYGHITLNYAMNMQPP